MFSGSKAPIPAHDFFYVRILDVCVTLACVMYSYAYRVGPDDHFVCYVSLLLLHVLCVYMFICYICMSGGA